MRTIRLVLVAAAFAPATGCKWIEDARADQGRGPRRTGALDPVQPDQLVGYINQRAAKLQSIEYGNTRLRCFQGSMPLPVLDGNMACAQPRNFRMVSNGRAVSAKLDLGSNDEHFWVYVQVPTEQPTYVYASHTDFQAGRAPIPGGIPFEPDWILQALGMTTLPANATYQVKPNEKDRTYTLHWPTTTPTNQAVTKEIVFDADTATGTRPQVKRHVMKDNRGKVVCSAEIKSAKPVLSTTEVGGPVVQYPTHVVLRWEEQKFEMDLTLDGAVVNQPANPAQAQRLFTRPNIPNVRAIDLARFDSK